MYYCYNLFHWYCSGLSVVASPSVHLVTHSKAPDWGGAVEGSRAVTGSGGERERGDWAGFLTPASRGEERRHWTKKLKPWTEAWPNTLATKQTVFYSDQIPVKINKIYLLDEGQQHIKFWIHISWFKVQRSLPNISPVYVAGPYCPA